MIVGLAAIAGVYLSSLIAMAFGRDVRSAVFSTVETFGQVEVNHFGPASLITRNTNDVQQVQQLVFVALTVMVSAPILIVGGIFMALRTDVPLSGLLVVVLPLMALVIGLVMSRAIPLFRATQAKLDRINQVMRETLAGVRVIRAFVRTRHEEARFETASRDLYDTPLRAGRLFALTIPVIIAILNLSTVAVIWFGAIRVQDGERCPIGDLTAFLQYLSQILFAVLTAVFVFILVPRAAVSAGRIHRGPRHRADHPRSGLNRSSPIRRARSVASSSSAASSSAIPGAKSPSSTTSRFAPSPAGRPRSSAAPAAARARSST